MDMVGALIKILSAGLDHGGGVLRGDLRGGDHGRAAFLRTLGPRTRPPPRRALSLLPLVAHEPGSKGAHGLKLVVRPAEEPKVPGRFRWDSPLRLVFTPTEPQSPGDTPPPPASTGPGSTGVGSDDTASTPLACGCVW